MKPQFTPGQSVNVKVSADVIKYGSVQRIAENVVYVKHFNGSIVGYKPELVTENVIAEKQQRPYGVGLKDEFAAIQAVMEKKLTPAEMKKREEVAKAIERENPNMPMGKKMAIATAIAKKVAEAVTDYNPKSQGGTRKELLAQLAKTKDSKHAEAARKAGASQDELRKAMQEDMHYCAKHVYSERFGEGFVVEGSHADPDENGLIEWYDVDFGGTIRRVMTEKVKVMHAEYHMNHKRKMKEEDEMEDEDEDDNNEKEMKEAKAHTIPKTAKEKDLAALAHPKDKITHADVMVGRGVKKEEMSSKEKMKRGLYNKEEAELEEAHQVVAKTKQGETFKSGVYPTKQQALDMHYKLAKSGKYKSVNTVKVAEQVDVQEAMISYSDFQAKIDAHKKAGNKIKDDKYDKNKASYTVVDQDGVGKKITHTPSGTTQAHLGQVEKVKDAEAQTNEKRGRGRPAGSKSGARN